MSANAHPHLANGTCLHLSVADTGCGMEPAVLARIYDPFFTTKPMGQGTGLGLSVVHGIMKSIGGGIRTESELGKGSVFHLYFPAAEAARSDAARAAPRKTTASGMGRRILYVDDESSLVFLMTRVLERSGYVVMGFTNPSDALQAFIAEPANFDAVVTDLAMPAMSGFEFASRIISVRPDTPILMTSGYVREEDERTARDIGVTRLVLKPDTVDRLVVELEQVLAQVAGQVNSARP